MPGTRPGMMKILGRFDTLDIVVVPPVVSSFSKSQA
jgi:hypothetical protein